MKLYEVYLNNGMCYGDKREINRMIVATSMKEAITRGKALLLSEMSKQIDKNKSYFEVVEITEIDGYNIRVD